MKYLYFLFVFNFAQFSWGKTNNSIEIEGTVLDARTKLPIPYAKIYNLSIGKGTISNLDGYFRLPISTYENQIIVSFMGYKKQVISIQKEIPFYTIYLEEEDRLLSEVVVGPNENDYLFDLVAKTRKNQSHARKTGKTYYELKSYHDTSQIELVEGFYTIHLKGSDIEGLDLKAGRLALQPYHGRYFASLESSRAITQLKTFDRNFYFPTSPIEVKKKELKTHFKLKLLAKFVDDQNDSIYHISFKPKKESGLFYYGEIWIDKDHETVKKINFQCDSCKKYPFLPIFPTDSIENVQFNITKTFADIDGEMIFNQIDFFYVIDYKSRIGTKNQQNYKIVTNAILYTYDFEEEFKFITPSKLPENVSDYRKYNATPYNDFFWQYNDEFRLKNQTNENETFFQSPNSHTNISVFKNLPHQKTGLFEHPFIQWSTNRILFREFLSDTIERPITNVIYDNYQLKVDFYVDLNTYTDSTDLFSAVIFNPFESFYHLPIAKETQCFINIYFDLYEIVRRKFETELSGTSYNFETIKERYIIYQKELEKEMNVFFKAVDRGTNRIELEKYNALVDEKLGIDNIALFRLDE